MDVTHFEIAKRHGAFELIVHSVDEHGRKHAVLAPDGRDTVMRKLGERCRLNEEFRHLQKNSKP